MLHRLIQRPLRLSLAATATLTALLSACAPPPAQPTSATDVASPLPDVTSVVPTARKYVSVRALSFRTGPNNGFRAKALLPIGTIVTPDGYVSGIWWQVDTAKYGTGWVNSYGLKPTSG